MRTEQVIFSKGINRSLDPRYIGNDEQYDAYNAEVVERGVLAKRKGFNRWRADAAAVLADVVRGIALMYDSDGNRYLFVFRDGSGTGTDLWVEKAGGTPLIISDFFPSQGYRVRSAVFGDKIYFVNGQDRPRWYQKYDDPDHIWGIGGVPSPARRPTDESDFDYFISRALYADCITSSGDLGIDPPGIWRYKQTIGYYGKEDDTQVEESNAGPASPMFHCQFNTAESLSATLEGYIKRGIPIGIADFDDLILDASESGGQDYEDEIRWMRFYRQWKMFSDELYSPFELLTEMKKGWPTSIKDVYLRDSATVAPTTRVNLPVAHHIARANNRLFLGRVEKELFTQPGLPADFRGLSSPDYKPNFSKRIPITITNTNAYTMTAVTIPLRFTDQTDAGSVATPPSGGGNWTGAYLNTLLDLSGIINGLYQMVFVDEDGITPLGFFRIGTVQVNAEDTVTFLVEIPEIVGGGSRTIYLYFEDSRLGSGSSPAEGEVGHWTSVAHYRLLASDHDFLVDWESNSSDPYDMFQKRSYAPVVSTSGTVSIVQNQETKFFSDSAKYYDEERCIELVSAGAGAAGKCEMKLYTSAEELTKFSFVFAAKVVTTAPSAGVTRAQIQLTNGAQTEHSVLVEFKPNDASTMSVVATIYYSGGSSTSLTLTNVSYSDKWLYFLVQVEDTNFRFICVDNPNTAHPAETASWDDSSFTVYSTSTTISLGVRFPSDRTFYGLADAIALSDYNTLRLKEVELAERIVDGQDELIQMSMHDSYWSNNGLAIAGDVEEAGAEKYPDRFYFSGLNTPNSFDAVDFRDLGDKGRPIQGIRPIRNRVFVFTTTDIRALFSAGSEQALALESGDARMWNLSHDLTGELGGIGVLAPDTLINMEFAGRDGVGFLSLRGFYFFDGQSFAHISERVDNLIRYHIDNYGKDFFAAFIKKKRQLLITPTDILDASPRMQVANMMFAQDVDSIVWTEWGVPMQYGVELDEYLDDSDFVFLRPYYNASDKAQVLKLDGNTGNDTHVDIKDDGVGSESKTNVTLGVQSKYFYLFDSEMIKCDLYMERNLGITPSTTLTLYADPTNIPGTPPTPTVTKSNPRIGMNRFPVGTNGMVFMFKISDNSASDLILERLNFYYNVHGERRLQGA